MMGLVEDEEVRARRASRVKDSCNCRLESAYVRPDLFELSR